MAACLCPTLLLQMAHVNTGQRTCTLVTHIHARPHAHIRTCMHRLPPLPSTLLPSPFQPPISTLPMPTLPPPHPPLPQPVESIGLDPMSVGPKTSATAQTPSGACPRTADAATAPAPSPGVGVQFPTPPAPPEPSLGVGVQFPTPYETPGGINASLFGPGPAAAAAGARRSGDSGSGVLPFRLPAAPGGAAAAAAACDGAGGGSGSKEAQQGSGSGSPVQGLVAPGDRRASVVTGAAAALQGRRLGTSPLQRAVAAAVAAAAASEGRDGGGFSFASGEEGPGGVIGGDRAPEDDAGRAGGVIGGVETPGDDARGRAAGNGRLSAGTGAGASPEGREAMLREIRMQMAAKGGAAPGAAGAGEVRERGTPVGPGARGVVGRGVETPQGGWCWAFLGGWGCLRVLERTSCCCNACTCAWVGVGASACFVPPPQKYPPIPSALPPTRPPFSLIPCSLN